MHPSELIRYIVWYATQQEIKLTTNRLVKFLYLTDLYYARIKTGETLTGFPWRFIYYGPFCSEAWEAINQTVVNGLICKETYPSSFDEVKEYHIFWCQDDDAENIENKIQIRVIGQLQKAIKKYGEDTPQLLDHVYFETEPMQGVKKGDLLNFSKCEMPKPIEKIVLKKLSPEIIKRAREKIKNLSVGLSADRKKFIEKEQEVDKYKGEAYNQFLKLLDGDELPVGLKGTAKIQMT
jgi:hypothetical protein